MVETIWVGDAPAMTELSSEIIVREDTSEIFVPNDVIV